MDRTSVVIPTLNEEDTIDGLVTQLYQLDGISEVIVVDDSSEDNTAALAENVGAEVIQRNGKPDLSLSVLEGIRSASNNSIVVMDGDGQHPVSTVPSIIEGLEEHDLMVASRRNVIGSWGAFRKSMSLFAKNSSRILFSGCRKVHDPISGFFGIRRDQHDLDSMAPKGYKILLEFLVQSENTGEVMYDFHQRNGGESSIGFSTTLDFLKHLADLKYRQVKSHERNQ